MAYDGMYMAPGPGYPDYNEVAQQISGGINGLASAQQAAYGARMAELDNQFQIEADSRKTELEMQRLMLDAAKERRADNDASARNLLEVQKQQMLQEEHDLKMVELKEAQIVASRERRTETALSADLGRLLGSSSPGEIYLLDKKIWANGGADLPQVRQDAIRQKSLMLSQTKVYHDAVEYGFGELASKHDSSVQSDRVLGAAVLVKSGLPIEQLIANTAPGTYSDLDLLEIRNLVNGSEIEIYGAERSQEIAAARDNILDVRLKRDGLALAKKYKDQEKIELAEAALRGAETRQEYLERPLRARGIRIGDSGELVKPPRDGGALFMQSRADRKPSLEYQQYMEAYAARAGEGASDEELNREFPLNQKAVGEVEDEIYGLSRNHASLLAIGAYDQAGVVASNITERFASIAGFYALNGRRAPTAIDLIGASAVSHPVVQREADQLNRNRLMDGTQEGTRPHSLPIKTLQYAPAPGSLAGGSAIPLSDYVAKLNEAAGASEKSFSGLSAPDVQFANSVGAGGIPGLRLDPETRRILFVEDDSIGVNPDTGGLVASSGAGPAEEVPLAEVEKSKIALREALARGSVVELALTPDQRLAKAYSNSLSDPSYEVTMAGGIRDVLAGGEGSPAALKRISALRMKGTSGVGLGERGSATAARVKTWWDWAGFRGKFAKVGRQVPAELTAASTPFAAPAAVGGFVRSVRSVLDSEPEVGMVKQISSGIVGEVFGGAALTPPVVGMALEAAALKKASSTFEANGDQSVQETMLTGYVNAFEYNRSNADRGVASGSLAVDSYGLAPTDSGMLSDAPLYSVGAKAMLELIEKGNLDGELKGLIKDESERILFSRYLRRLAKEPIRYAPGLSYERAMRAMLGLEDEPTVAAIPGKMP